MRSLNPRFRPNCGSEQVSVQLSTPGEAMGHRAQHPSCHPSSPQRQTLFGWQQLGRLKCSLKGLARGACLFFGLLHCAGSGQRARANPRSRCRSCRRGRLKRQWQCCNTHIHIPFSVYFVYMCESFSTQAIASTPPLGIKFIAWMKGGHCQCPSALGPDLKLDIKAKVEHAKIKEQSALRRPWCVSLTRTPTCLAT